MGDYRKHRSQDSRRYSGAAGLAMPHQYSSGEEQNYVYSNNNQYVTQSSYNPYASQMLASYSQQHSPVTSDASHLSSHYSSPQSLYAPSPQPSVLPHGYQYTQQYSSHSRYPSTHRYFAHEAFREPDIEAQESCNENTMQSEPVIPALEGFPNVQEFDQLMKSYVDELSVKKQDKALIHAKRARNIRMVLLDPKDTAVESAQFRFWVKKMFKLEPNDGRTPDSRRLICHEGKPVAIREKLFKILTRAHQQCQHGGRDKTSAQVRKIYSWVPKELISRFVKVCPTCRNRRGATRGSPPATRQCSPRLGSLSGHSMLLSPSDSRRDSVISRPGGDRPQSNYTHVPGSAWGNSASHHHMHGQYHHNLHSASPAGLGTLPRSMVGGSAGGTTMGPLTGSISMSPNHLDYGTTYESTHSLNDPHY
ncbi:hypothetical protein AJ80_07326 [Polytolypa hystricis UAMH7299]|uniref:Integrase zinc-binding domain-containing protein n=1 Tax=Polytolypa hystricis (strain UAMH7299) TaxID=1447883 RepID=A0A2B7XPS2_POLH7|nr:hypothetical protein AJ80_07326 [Polytolypa hystricis UAMH7299]